MGDTSPCLYSKRKERWRMRGGVEEVGQDGVSSWSRISGEEGSCGTQRPGGKIHFREDEGHSSLEIKEVRSLQIHL